MNTNEFEVETPRDAIIALHAKKASVVLREWIANASEHVLHLSPAFAEHRVTQSGDGTGELFLVDLSSPASIRQEVLNSINVISVRDVLFSNILQRTPYTEPNNSP